MPDANEELAAFKALGLTPDQIREMQTTLLGMRTDFLADEAAQLMGWKPDVLRPLIRAHDLAIEFRDVAVKGDDGVTTVRTAFVKPRADAEAPLQPLDAYVSANLAVFADALRASETSDTPRPGIGPAARRPAPPGGQPRFPAVPPNAVRSGRSTDAAAQKDAYERKRTDMHERGLAGF